MTREVPVDPELAEQLERLAGERGESVKDLVERAIREYVEGR